MQWALWREGLHWRRFDDTVLVYNDRSGATHRLNGLEGWVFERLASDPADLDGLAGEAEQLVDDSGQPHIRSVIARTLELLEQFAVARRLMPAA